VGAGADAIADSHEAPQVLEWLYLIFTCGQVEIADCRGNCAEARAKRRDPLIPFMPQVRLSDPAVFSPYSDKFRLTPLIYER
jgi:hypothetical protein